MNLLLMLCASLLWNVNPAVPAEHAHPTGVDVHAATMGGGKCKCFGLLSFLLCPLQCGPKCSSNCGGDSCGKSKCCGH